jgi:hypothetical protein
MAPGWNTHSLAPEDTPAGGLSIALRESSF